MHLHEWVITWILLTFVEIFAIVYIFRKRDTVFRSRLLLAVTIVYLIACGVILFRLADKTYIGGKRSFCEEHIKITHKNVEDHTTIQEKCTRFVEYIYTESGSWKRIGDIRE